VPATTALPIPRSREWTDASALLPLQPNHQLLNLLSGGDFHRQCQFPEDPHHRLVLDEDLGGEGGRPLALGQADEVGDAVGEQLGLHPEVLLAREGGEDGVGDAAVAW
jgi:hypothetical protein